MSTLQKTRMKLLTLFALLAVAPCFAEDKVEETTAAPEAAAEVTSEAPAQK